MVDRNALVWVLRLIFIGVITAHAYYLLRTGRGLESNISLYGFLKFIWAPVASGATAASLFYIGLEKWLWRWPLMKGWLVQFPDLTGTWLARSSSETFADAPHYAVIAIDHRFDRLSYRAWRKEASSSLGGGGEVPLPLEVPPRAAPRRSSNVLIHA
jgi:hypothetical protein